MIVPPSLRKVLHQHLITLFHSQKAVTIALLSIILLVVSFLQFSDTVLEWSVDKYEFLQRTYTISDNIAGRSFEKELSYSSPIDVVYTWVNGSDPCHQQQLERYQNQLRTSSRASEALQTTIDASNDGVAEGTSANPRKWRSYSIPGTTFAESLRPSVMSSTSSEDRWNVFCSSSSCVRANAVLVSPVISLEDLSEVLGNSPISSVVAYNLTNLNASFSLVPESFDLDDLLEEARLWVNDKDFRFVSVHLTVEARDIKIPGCETMEFVRLILGISDSLTKDQLRASFPEEIRRFIREIDIYQSRNMAVVYFSEKARLLDEIPENMVVLERTVNVSRVCMLANIKPSSSENELRLSRFKDNEEMRYSIRSVQKHAGWVRRIFIVTNGQIPHWLNLNNPRVQIVTHEEIFSNRSHLPTFSSSAIEAHLHRIPGLSKKFLYFNDDVFLGQDVLPEDFFSHSEGYKVHLSWHVPSCAEGCPSGWIHDGFCDASCNNELCNFDGGDCANKTSAMEDDDFGFGFQSDQFSGTCYPGCLDAWLADRYCDIVCNHEECGFDIGDCGLDKLRKFPHVQLEETQEEYVLPRGATVVVFNASDLFAKENVTLKEGTYKRAKAIRVVSVYPKRSAVILFLYSNATGAAELTLDFSIGERSNVKFVFTVIFDSTELKDIEDLDDGEVEGIVERQKSAITFATVPSHLRGPKAVYYHPEDPLKADGGNRTAALLNLEHQFLRGELTEYGLARKKALILGEPINSSYSSPPTRVQPSSTAISSTIRHVFDNEKTTVRLQHKPARSTNARLVRPNTKAPIYVPQKSRGIKYVDAFADSLRYVNRLYNDAFGIEPRKVPAHVPHFIDREVMDELQKKFPVEFDLTSATRIRSSHDMQYAFSYFYFVMSSRKEVSMGEIFDEIDMDHSGTWDHREIYMAAIRFLDPGSTTSVAIREFEMMLIENCSGKSDRFQGMNLIAKNEVDLSPFFIYKKDLLACEPVAKTLISSVGKRKRFKFRLGDAEVMSYRALLGESSIDSWHIKRLKEASKKTI